MFTGIQGIEKELVTAGLGRDEAALLAGLARPAVWLRTHPAGDAQAIPRTRIGGLPDLPPGVEWPQRPAFGEDAQSVRELRKQIANPEAAWGHWASAEQCEQFRHDSEQHLARLLRRSPLSFIAQFDFAELWAAGPLDPDMPRSGVLSLFYDAFEQPWGFDPTDASCVRVLFHEAAEALTPRQAPDDLAAFGEAGVLPTLAGEPQACWTPLPLATATADRLGLSGEAEDCLHEWWTEDDRLYSSEGGEDWKCHHVGGWPTPVQGDMQTECALVAAGQYCGNGDAYRDPALAPVRETATDWLLLVQIGSDEKAGMMWGDNGQLYLWIRRADLQVRRFGAARLVLQCY